MQIWAKLQAKPNFSSQFLWVNGILKFANMLCRLSFFVKGEGAWITVCLQLQACEAKEFPFHLNNPLTQTTLDVACFSASHCMRLETQANFKIYGQTYHGSKFSAKQSAA